MPVGGTPPIIGICPAIGAVVVIVDVLDDKGETIPLVDITESLRLRLSEGIPSIVGLNSVANGFNVDLVALGGGSVDDSSLFVDDLGGVVVVSDLSFVLGSFSVELSALVVSVLLVSTVAAAVLSIVSFVCC
jgi:hypothetical protein